MIFKIVSQKIWAKISPKCQFFAENCYHNIESDAAQPDLHEIPTFDNFFTKTNTRKNIKWIFFDGLSYFCGVGIFLPKFVFCTAPFFKL
jgi:hypothetical protein